MKNHDSAPAEGRIRAGRRWWGAGLAALCGGGLGLAVGLFQPRGPVTPVDAFELIVGGLVVGLVVYFVYGIHNSVLNHPEKRTTMPKPEVEADDIGISPDKA